MPKTKEVQIVKVPALYLIMDGSTLLASARREFTASEVCRGEGWTPGAVQEFGGWLKNLTSKTIKGTAQKATKSP